MGFNKSINVDWDYLKQESFVSDRGTDVIHEIGVACTCRTVDVYAPSIPPQTYCTKCDGYGFIYRNPTRIEGLLTSISQSKALLMTGWAIPGDCFFSPHMAYDPGVSDFDRITFTHTQPVNEGQTLVRGAATKGNNKFFDLGLGPLDDRLFYQAVTSLHCEDENGKIYSQDSDFELNGAVISWHEGIIPVNTKYTVKYEGYLEWIAFVGPFERRDRAQNLGQKVLLRKRHIAVTTNFQPKVTNEERARLGIGEGQLGSILA